MTAGDDSGKIWVYDVGEQLAMPQADEWNKFAYTLQDIKNNQQDEDFELKLSSSSASAGGHPSLVPGSGHLSMLGGGAGVMTAAGGGGGSGPGSLSSLPSMSGSPMR